MFSNRGRGRPGDARISYIMSRNFKAEFFLVIGEGGSQGARTYHT